VPVKPPVPIPAPPPAPSPRPAPVAPRLFSGFVVQAGVFTSTQRAEELHARLALHGIPSTIEARVQVGPFKSQAEADAVRAKMKAVGIDGVVLPLVQR
ncbi:MAG: SPOR domain-containing protein, partial [Azovibrio sp.]|uniref:SPOR domain-containing protein n=1 Tax=Azovibrio sp. TaxID=1872673 RepID=UPI003C70C7B3